LQRSESRFLTTHGGSFTRPDDLLKVIQAKDSGNTYDEEQLEAMVRRAVFEGVQRQVALGLDIPSDGEFSKPSFYTYVKDRLSGFEGKYVRSGRRTTDPDLFPEYAEADAESPCCTSKIEWRNFSSVLDDISNFRSALDAIGFQGDAFLPAVSPGTVLMGGFANQFYDNDEEYLDALADALHREYKAIVDAGFILQIDAPDMGYGRAMPVPALSIGEFRKTLRLYIDAVNRAIGNLPRDRIRLHVCWGNYEAPHLWDVELKEIVTDVLQVRAGALYIEQANPRHAHEWRVWETVRLPDDYILIPGVIDTKTNIVEHPELVSERIVRVANLVGRENVIVAPDCGFGTGAGRRRVYPSVQWAKLEALVQGAQLATATMW
jgi:5-methyltetrahydropteroyltriglutamate--homocysteine methyltransferase